MGLFTCSEELKLKSLKTVGSIMQVKILILGAFPLARLKLISNLFGNKGGKNWIKSQVKSRV